VTSAEGRAKKQMSKSLTSRFERCIHTPKEHTLRGLKSKIKNRASVTSLRTKLSFMYNVVMMITRRILDQLPSVQCRSVFCMYVYNLYCTELHVCRLEGWRLEETPQPVTAVTQRGTGIPATQSPKAPKVRQFRVALSEMPNVAQRLVCNPPG
jgi:hypothetical protein